MKNNVKANLIAYNSYEQCQKAVSSNKCDGFVIGVNALAGFTPIETFSFTPYYLATRSSDIDLKNKIDSGMEKILKYEPTYLESLNKKYLASQAKDLSFTKEEKAYIKTHSEIKVAVIDNDAPYYYADSNKKIHGVIPDFYNKLGKDCGITFKYVVYHSQSEAIAAVKAGKVDIIGMYSSGLINAYNDNLRLSKTYTTVTTIVLRHSNTPSKDIKRIAVKGRSRKAIKASLPSEYAKAKLVGYNNAEDCFAALENGEVDAMISGLPSTSYLVNQTNTPSYSMVALSNLRLDLNAAMAYDNLTLCSIIDKTIRADAYMFDSIVSNNTQGKNDWQSFIARIPAGWIIAFAAVMITLVLGLVVALVMLGKRQKEKEQIEQQRVLNEKRQQELEASERSSEEKNRFFSNISHDMRTPLNAILGFTTLLKHNELDEESRDYVNKIQTSGELLMNLINDTLMISKISSGKMEIRPKAVWLADLLESIAVPIREAAAQKHIEFKLDKSQMRDRYVSADRINTQKIFLNLLSNAIKYTDPYGHVTFSVADGCMDSEGLTFFVSDDGLGISAEFLPNIYQPFTQEEINATNGTGLGLSIVKQLVTLMNGVISVESQKGVGTTFKVELPFKETIDDKQLTGEFNMLTKYIDNLKGKKVLVCEDNSLNMEITKSLLANVGIEVVEANNGLQGVKAFKASTLFEFDAVLMDIRMPVMDGYEATRLIRQSERKDASLIPIIALSADAYDEDMHNSIETGMDAHINKPINPNRLYQVLAGYINRRSTKTIR